VNGECYALKRRKYDIEILISRVYLKTSIHPHEEKAMLNDSLSLARKTSRFPVLIFKSLLICNLERQFFMSFSYDQRPMTNLL